MDAVGNLADVVYHQRTRLGISQRELAERANVSRGTIVEVESGKSTGIRFETVCKIVTALGLELRFAPRRIVSATVDEDAAAARERFRRRFQEGGARNYAVLQARKS